MAYTVNSIMDFEVIRNEIPTRFAQAQSRINSALEELRNAEKALLKLEQDCLPVTAFFTTGVGATSAAMAPDALKWATVAPEYKSFRELVTRKIQAYDDTI